MESLSTTPSPNATEQEWYHHWLAFLLAPPFYQASDQELIYSYFKQICEALERGDSCIALAAYDGRLDALTQKIQEQQQQPKPLVWDAPYLYLQRYWALEAALAQQIYQLAQTQVEAIDIAAYQHFFQDPQQQRALDIGVNSALAMITGGPGTGKTYILTRIVAVLKKCYPAMRIAMAAPTGKAAQRMQEALQQAFHGGDLKQMGLYHPDFDLQRTQTIHRLLGMGQQQLAKYNQQQPLPYDVVVIDEASMLDLNLAKQLCEAIRPPTRLILLGDAQQLSSVDVGYVLADVHQVPALSSCQIALQKSRRFSDDALIGRFARYIYTASSASVQDWLLALQPQNLHHDAQGDVSAAVAETAIDYLGYYALSESRTPLHYQHLYQHFALGYQPYVEALRCFARGEIDVIQLTQAFDTYRILVVMRYFELGLEAINTAITHVVRQQLGLVHAGEWFLGRPVMMQYNDYQLGLSNGDIGLCIADADDASQYSVYFPSLNKAISAARLPQSIQTAFALTIHKSQGSEFSHVAVVLDERAELLLTKELLYTAITRAKHRVSLYCSATAFECSLKQTTERKSGLTQQLNRLFGNSG